MARKLEPGMLVLDPGEGENPRPTVWTVVSARTVIAHYGDASVRATLRSSELPKPLSSAKAMALGAVGLSPAFRRDLEQSNERAEAMARAWRLIDRG